MDIFWVSAHEGFSNSLGLDEGTNQKQDRLHVAKHLSGVHSKINDLQHSWQSQNLHIAVWITLATSVENYSGKATSGANQCSPSQGSARDGWGIDFFAKNPTADFKGYLNDIEVHIWKKKSWSPTHHFGRALGIRTNPPQSFFPFHWDCSRWHLRGTAQQVDLVVWIYYNYL